MTTTDHTVSATSELPPLRPLRAIADDYFATHPEAKADATRKGELLMRQDWHASHRYTHKDGETMCWVCGQDWHAKDLRRCPGFNRVETEDAPTKTKRILADEHALYMETIARCERMVRRRHKDWSTLTGEKIAVLHHTHGCGVEELEWILDSTIPRQLLADYEAAMDNERARSRAAQVKEIITVSKRP